MNKTDSRPSWDEFFLTLAIVVGTRSSCKHVKCGCVVTLGKTLIGIGYNGAPPGVVSCLERGCQKENLGFSYKNSLNTGLCVGVHAEMNALANMTKTLHQGATVYVTIFPCSACAKTLLAYNIARVVYKMKYDDQGKSRMAERLFKEAGVKIEKLNISPKRISDFLFNQPAVDFDIFSKKEKLKI